MRSCIEVAHNLNRRMSVCDSRKRDWLLVSAEVCARGGVGRDEKNKSLVIFIAITRIINLRCPGRRRQLRASSRRMLSHALSDTTLPFHSVGERRFHLMRFANWPIHQACRSELDNAASILWLTL